MSTQTWPAPITAATLGRLFEFSYNVTKQNIDGFTHEESIRHAKEAGNPLNWIVGHIVANRDGVLKILGQEPVWDEDELEGYGHGSAPHPDGEGAMPWDKILRDFDTTQERLREGLQHLTAEALNQGLTEEQNFLGLDNVGEMLAAYNFHESYHAGQTGIMRRVLGREGVIG